MWLVGRRVNEITGGNRDLESGEEQNVNPVKAAVTCSDSRADGFQVRIVMLIITMANTISMIVISASSVASMVLVVCVSSD